jgi:hypothetical protein
MDGRVGRKGLNRGQKGPPVGRDRGEIILDVGAANENIRYI